ncbi:ATP-binding protein [Aquabacterium sp.]|uniref:ATP-binding protein n=1 Tax=Aquabacterium sp. TaxID=1872578 RepID=UPI0035AE16D4
MRSLQGRLLAGVLGVAVAVWLLAAAWTWFGAQHELDELLDGHLAQAAALVISRQSEGGERDHHRGHSRGHADDDDDDPRHPAATLHRYAPRVAFQVWQDGQLVARSGTAPEQPFATAASGFSSVEHDGVRWRVFGAPGRDPGSQVWVGERLDARDAILRAVLRGQLAPLALALPLLGLAVWVAVRASLGPLRELRQAVIERAPQATTALNLPQAPAELAPLVAALNELFARIAQLIEAERRFTADAAHELRTPIAAIRMQAQVAQAATQDAERQRALSATLTGCDRAAHLVEQLLTLARVEGSDGAPAPQALDLAALARRVAAEVAPQALARRQQLELHADQPSAVVGHEALLSVLLRNLLDNACRYSPAGARIELRIDAHAGQPRCQVADSGPGLSDADRARLGERFFRVLGNEQPGSGLGWSIVRRVAQLHGLQIDVARSPALGGLQVTLTWPVAMPSSTTTT